MSLLDDVEWMRSHMPESGEMRRRLDRITAALAAAQETGRPSEDVIYDIEAVGRYVEIRHMKLPGPARYRLTRVYTEPTK